MTAAVVLRHLYLEMCFNPNIIKPVNSRKRTVTYLELKNSNVILIFIFLKRHHMILEVELSKVIEIEACRRTVSR